MSRPKWKGFFTNLDKKIEKKFNLTKATRSSKITPKLIGQTFKVFNGQNSSELVITQDMLGHKFGEFVFTRKKFQFKKKNKKKLKKK